ncbi:MAG: VanZ family protein [Phycisphaerales bacterium]|nr:VanZ family protein [Phycisphaerales bacterium]MCB9857103.1 VanZ family protein [Phycisphaerales bacterium]MCB9861770.1 VanZ family protein [Phycisphaerales bacterium]
MQPARLDISDEPLIRAIHRRAAILGFLLFAAALAWMCFVPFDLTRHPYNPPHSRRVGYLLLTGLSLIDVFANIGIYLPFGGLCLLALRSLRANRFLAIIGATLTAAAFSLSVEHAQYFIASRVASWIDVFCNVTGAAVGATITAAFEPILRLIFRRFTASAQRNWWAVIAKGAVCALILIHLRPYDIVIDKGSAAAGLLRADFNPAAAWNALPETAAKLVKEGRIEARERSRMELEYLLDRVTDIASYAGLTILLWLGFRPRRFFGYVRAVGGSAFVVLCTAFTITLLRQFLASHGLDTAHFVAACAGWIIGAVLSLMLLRNVSEEASSANPSFNFRLPRSIGTLGACVAIAAILGYELVPFDFNTTGIAKTGMFEKVNLMPFMVHFHSRPNDALYDISGECLIYSAVGLCIAGSLYRRTRLRWRTQFVVTVVGTAAISAALQIAHLFMLTRRTDVTTVLLATISAATMSLGLKWLTDYRRFVSTRYADDLLTRQLIEGETYDKNALKSLEKRRSDASPSPTPQSAEPD